MTSNEGTAETNPPPDISHESLIAEDLLSAGEPGLDATSRDFVGALRWGGDGLLPAVIQDADSREVLILAYTTAETLERTLETGLVHLWSRSRGAPWLKGETSGRLLHLVEVRPNCELDSLLLLVRQALPGACHTGHAGCFYRRLGPDSRLEELSPPVFAAADVYGADASSSGALSAERGRADDVIHTPPADTDAAEDELALLLGAYQWLRDQPVVAESRTSRLLHGDGPDPLARLREEWEELLGVLDGTHRHGDPAADALLEATQVLYWTCLTALTRELRAAPGEPSVPLGDGYREGGDAHAALERALAASAPERRAVGLWRAFGTACRALGLDPAAVVRRDLIELRTRPYMAACFARRER